MQCQEVPQLRLNTQSRTIFFNSHGSIGKVTPELQGFFDLMNGQPDQTNSFTSKIESDIDKVKADTIKEAEFMDLAMKLNDERQAGIREGKQEGLAKGKKVERMEIAMSLTKDFQQEGLSSTEIRQRLQHIFHGKLSEEQLNKIIKR